MRKILIICISFLFSKFLHSQANYDTKSQFTKHLIDVNSNVNNLGQVNVQLPLTNISIQNYDLNLKLIYKGGGVKVNKDSDLFGMNWNINGNGLISRKVNGFPDEVKNSIFLYFRRTNGPYGCHELVEKENVGYLNNSNAVENVITSYLSNFPNVPTVINRNLLNHPLRSRSFISPRLFYNIQDPAMVKDYEPDVFTVSIPGYEPFDFFFDLNQNVVITNNEKYNIQYTLSNNNFKTFTIVDTKGNVFKFNSREQFNISNLKTRYLNAVGILPSSRFKDQNSLTNYIHFCPDVSQNLKDNYNKDFTNVWYLSSIENNKKEVIKFRYKNKKINKISSPVNSNLTYYVKQGNNVDQDYYLDTTSFSGITQIRPKYSTIVNRLITPFLEYIITPNKIIHFKEGDLRKDVSNNDEEDGLREVSSIDVWSYHNPSALLYLGFDYSTGHLLKKFNLDYIYSSSNVETTLDTEYASKRLFLTRVTEKKHEIETNVSSFNYYGDLNLLPHKQTLERDYWNYFKQGDVYGAVPNLYYYPSDGRDNVDLGPFSIYPRVDFQGEQIQLENYYPDREMFNNFMDKSPDINSTIIGSLKSVSNKMGQIQTFFYEPNYFTYYGVQRVSGGLRVKSIETTSLDTDTNNVTEYSYGNNGSGVVYMNTGINRLEMNPKLSRDWGEVHSPYLKPTVALNYLKEVSSPTYYDKIKITQKDNNGNIKGYIVNQFSLFHDSPTNSGFQLGGGQYVSNIFNSYSLIFDHKESVYGNQTTNVFYKNNTSDYYPFNEKETFNEINGRLLNTQKFDNTGKLLTETNYNYNLNVQDYSFVKDYPSGYRPAGSLYKIRKFSYLLDTITTKKYFNSETPLKTIKSISYNTYNKVKKEIITYPNNDVSINEITYCYENASPIYGTVHNVSDICKIKTNKNGKSKIQDFFYNHHTVPYGPIRLGLILPYLSYSDTSIITNDYSKVTIDDGVTHTNSVKINRRGLNGIPLEKEYNSFTESIIYGYNQKLPIAKIRGIKYNELLTLLELNPNNSKAFLQIPICQKSNLDTNAVTEQQLIDALDEFRKLPALKDYQITTYTYDPLIGVTSITPPSGIRQVYLYDDANRLKEVREGSATGKLLKAHEYHYKQ